MNEIMWPGKGSTRFLPIRIVPRQAILLRDSGQEGSGFIDSLELLSQLKSPTSEKITKRNSPKKIMNIDPLTTRQERNAESEAPEGR